MYIYTYIYILIIEWGDFRTSGEKVKTCSKICSKSQTVATLSENKRNQIHAFFVTIVCVCSYW